MRPGPTSASSSSRRVRPVFASAPRSGVRTRSFTPGPDRSASRPSTGGGSWPGGVYGSVASIQMGGVPSTRTTA